jgi:CHAT domain-containing protein
VNLEGENRYGAFIVNSEKKTPTVIDICSVDEASSQLTKDSTSVNICYSSSKLYSTFIQKIEPYILHDTLIVCPVGVLEMVNFDAITNNEHRLMDKYQIYRSYSGHSFINGTRNHRYSPRTAALFGGIAYSKEQRQEAETASRHFRLSRGTHSFRGSLQYLQYSAEEIAAIRDILIDNKFRCNIYSGLDATESSFKKLEDASPGLIHIATHGFFMRKDSDLINHSFFNNLELYQDYKLLRSGLFMSNSNSSWNGLEPISGDTDGIITAYEISKLDLSNVNLAVLSACETAEGFIDNIESTQGLQYAFRLAGAGSLILNLWKVDDTVSFLFMKHFYSSLFSKHNLLDAYHEAIRKLIIDYPDPYDWAGFILVFN